MPIWPVDILGEVCRLALVVQGGPGTPFGPLLVGLGDAKAGRKRGAWRDAQHQGGA